MRRARRFLRPAIFQGTPGKGSGLYIARNGARVLVANIMGRVFMCIPNSTIRSSGRARAFGLSASASRRMRWWSTSTPERPAKMCFAHFVDGRASLLVVGTHPPADGRPPRSSTAAAYLSDAGMCGDYDSSLGMDKEEPLNRFLSKVPRPCEAANGPATLCGVGVHFRPDRARRARRAAAARPAAGRDGAFLLAVRSAPVHTNLTLSSLELPSDTVSPSWP